MAKILPNETLLPVIDEGQFATYTFEYELELEETLVEFKIINTTFPDSITINGATFSGVFADLFRLPHGSLKYRIGDELKSADSFADLPPKGTADLYSYSAPSQMIDHFYVTVELKYSDVAGGEPLNISKTYTQPIEGNWNTFRELFLNYVR